MSEKCANTFLDQDIDKNYKNDAFFDTWCYDESTLKSSMYTIKEDDVKI